MSEVKVLTCMPKSRPTQFYKEVDKYLHSLEDFSEYENVLFEIMAISKAHKIKMCKKECEMCLINYMN